MNCWKILGIDKDSSKKTIKIAYAKLLKTTKPDDDPEGFKKLHEAYKKALASITTTDNKQSSPQWFTPPHKKHTPPLLHDVSSDVIVKDLTNHHAVIDDETDESEYNLHRSTSQDREISQQISSIDIELKEHNRQQQLYDDWDKLITQVKLLLKEDPKNSKVSDWEFIAELPSMLDLEFRSEASKHIFKVVSNTNKKSLQQNILWVKTAILDYLNSLFHWDKQWREFKKSHGLQINAIYPFLNLTKIDYRKITAKKLGKQSDYYYQRLMAYIVDLSLIFLFIWINIHYKTVSYPLLSVAAVYMLVIAPIMEASRYQASVGKLLFRLKVVDIDESPITIYRSFLRMLATLVCITAFAPIAAAVNFYLYCSPRGNILCQDVMTKTYVVNK